MLQQSHTILGSRAQRGLTQLSLDLLYRSLATKILHPDQSPSLVASLSATDPSEAQILSARSFLDSVYGDALQSQAPSRAQTPMVGNFSHSNPRIPPSSGLKSQWSILGLDANSPRPSCTDTIKLVKETSLPISRVPQDEIVPWSSGQPHRGAHLEKTTRTKSKVRLNNNLQDSGYTPSAPKRKFPQRPSALPQFPDVSDLAFSVESNTEHAILVSMYEVYNDRIFDLLSVPSNQKDLRRRALLFKSTEASPERKVVAGLRKIACGTYEEALMVLETGLIERRVAGTGSNSVSSRSHGFFCVEVKRRPRGGLANAWTGTQLTVVDLAGEPSKVFHDTSESNPVPGSERARNAKTAGATLAEAGKINESLMYLGQCLQMQSDSHEGTKVGGNGPNL